MVRKYGWRRSTRPSPHPRYRVPARYRDPSALPASVDLTPQCPAVYDQGQLGSCTANALAGLFQFLQIKLGLASWVPSRLMLYYGERAIEGTVPTDSGANGDDGVTVLATDGVCPEADWPYVVTQFTVDPPPGDWAEATANKRFRLVTIADGDLAGVKASLASGFPVAIGFSVYEEIESDAVAASGILPDPTPGEPSIGGHEVLLVGYDEPSQRFRSAELWGAAWGQAGYFTISYAYVGDNERGRATSRSAGGATGCAPDSGTGTHAHAHAHAHACSRSLP